MIPLESLRLRNPDLRMYSVDDPAFLPYGRVLARRIDALSTELKNSQASETVSAEQIDAWYEETLEAQKSKYTSGPEEFYYDQQDYRDGYSATPALYVPDGYIRVQVIEAIPEGTIDAKVKENSDAMAALEAEYGALALNDGDALRRTEIETEYAALKAENEAIESAFYAEARVRIDEAYAKLEGGASFEDAMQAFNTHDEEGSGTDERLLYVNGGDALAAYASTLEAGSYSEPVLIDGAYVIVKLVEVLAEGTVDRAQIEDAVTAAAKASILDDAWDALFDAWLTEAKEIVVFHRETYDMLGDMYLY